MLNWQNMWQRMGRLGTDHKEFHSVIQVDPLSVKTAMLISRQKVVRFFLFASDYSDPKSYSCCHGFLIKHAAFLKLCKETCHFIWGMEQGHLQGKQEVFL